MVYQDVGLFVYLLLVYFFSYDAWMVVLQSLVMLPQIVFNVRQGNNPGFEPLYVLGYMGTRILLPCYQHIFADTFFKLMPDLTLVTAIILLYFVQVHF